MFERLLIVKHLYYHLQWKTDILTAISEKKKKKRGGKGKKDKESTFHCITFTWKNKWEMHEKVSINMNPNKYFKEIYPSEKLHEYWTLKKKSKKQ